MKATFVTIPHEYSVVDMVTKPRGTVTHLSVVDPNRVLEMREILISLAIRNYGRRAIQIFAVIVEAISPKDKLVVFEITPDTLPTVLDSLGGVEVTFQKEVLDLFDEVTFIGVVDALGRRHGLKQKDAKELLEESWNKPSRVKGFRKKDEEGGDILTAFQAADEMRFMTHEPRRRRPKPLLSRTAEHQLMSSPEMSSDNEVNTLSEQALRSQMNETPPTEKS